jgi:hypothetical protein
MGEVVASFRGHLLGIAKVRDELHVRVQLRWIGLNENVDEQREKVVRAGGRPSFPTIEKLYEEVSEGRGREVDEKRKRRGREEEEKRKRRERQRRRGGGEEWREKRAGEEEKKESGSLTVYDFAGVEDADEFVARSLIGVHLL